MTFWSGETLEKQIFIQNIVSPFSKDQIDCSAYTLRMGSEYFVTSDGTRGSGASVKKTLAEGLDGGCGEQFSIPPGQFAFLLTEETVRIPNNTMGFISLKSRTKFRGLINVSGFHVDPGYHGRLVFSVYNAGPLPITLARGDNLFLIWIANLDLKNTTKHKTHNENAKKSLDSSMVTNVSGKVHSLQYLSEKIARVENLMIAYATIGAFIGLVVSLLITSFAAEPVASFIGRLLKNTPIS